MNSENLKFLITGPALATCSGKKILRLKSLIINIMCRVGSSLINEIKSSMKEPRGAGIWYTINNKIASFLISSAIGNTFKTVCISIISMMFSLLTLQY